MQFCLHKVFIYFLLLRDEFSALNPAQDILSLPELNYGCTNNELHPSVSTWIDVALEVNQMDVIACLTNELYLTVNFFCIGKTV